MQYAKNRFETALLIAGKWQFQYECNTSVCDAPSSIAFRFDIEK